MSRQGTNQEKVIARSEQTRTGSRMTVLQTLKEVPRKPLVT